MIARVRRFLFKPILKNSFLIMVIYFFYQVVNFSVENDH